MVRKFLVGAVALFAVAVAAVTLNSTPAQAVPVGDVKMVAASDPVPPSGTEAPSRHYGGYGYGGYSPYRPYGYGGYQPYGGYRPYGYGGYQPYGSYRPYGSPYGGYRPYGYSPYGYRPYGYGYRSN